MSHSRNTTFLERMNDKLVASVEAKNARGIAEVIHDIRDAGYAAYADELTEEFNDILKDADNI